MATRKLEVVLVGDDRQLSRTLNRSQAQMTKYGKAAKVAGSITAAGLGIGLLKITDAAADAEKSQARLNAQLKTMGKNTPAVKKEIDKTVQSLSRMSAFDDEKIQDAFTNIVRSTGNVSKAMDYTAIAADLARGKQIDVAKAGEIVGKVAGGNTGILSRYGIQIQKGATASQALALVQQKFQGQAKAYGDTTAGSMDKIKVAAENLAESAGGVLTPSITKAGNTLATFLQQIQTGEGAGGRFAAVIRNIGTTIGTWFQQNRRSFILTGQVIAEFGRAVAGVFQHVILPVVRAVLPAIQVMVKGWGQQFLGVIRVITGLLTGDWRKAWQGLKMIASGALNAVVGLLRVMTTPIRAAAGAIGGAIRGVIGGAFNAIKKIAGDAGALMLRVLDKILGGISSMASAASKVPVIGKKFKGLADDVNHARDRLRGAADQLDRIGEKKRINVKVNVGIGISQAGKKVQGFGGTGDRSLEGMIGGAATDYVKKHPSLYSDGASGPLGKAKGALGSIEGIAHTFGLATTSGFRPGDPGWHGKNRARDFSDGVSTRAEMAFAKFMEGTYGSNLLELIHTPLGHGIKNGKRVPLSFWGPKVNAMHYNHVHVAMQRGGLVPGAGSGDRVPAMLEPGEGIINREAVRGMGGASAIHRINKAIPRFQKGGVAGTAAQAAYAAGFRGDTLVKMVAIAGRESRYNPRAQNLKYPDHSIGLWQINQLAHHGRYGSDRQLMDPFVNARAAWQLFKASGFQPWSTRNSYQGYLGQARAAVAALKGGKLPKGSSKGKARKVAAGLRAIEYGNAMTDDRTVSTDFSGAKKVLAGKPFSTSLTTPDAAAADTTAQDTANAIAQALVEQNARLAAIQSELKTQNDFSKSVASVTSREAVKALADVISGQIGATAGSRGQTAGTGNLYAVGRI